jgi:hypothetical protein
MFLTKRFIGRQTSTDSVENESGWYCRKATGRYKNQQAPATSMPCCSSFRRTQRWRFSPSRLRITDTRDANRKRAWSVSSMMRSLSLQWNSHKVGCEGMTVSVVLRRHSLQRGKESTRSTVTGSESNAGEQAANRVSRSDHSAANRR